MKFSKTPYFKEQLWTTAFGFWLKVFGKPQMNALYLETLTLEVPFWYTFPSRQHKLPMYVFIGLHCLLPEAATRVEVFCKKRCS